jgi:hypothetical protein
MKAGSSPPRPRAHNRAAAISEDPMTQRKFVVTYDAIAADILDNGSDRPAALVLVASDQQRVLIRMDRHAMARLKKRIDRTFLRRARGVVPLRP